MQRGFLLDVVVGKRATVFELLAREDQTLLVRRDPFLVLNLGLYCFDGVSRLDFERDGFSGESLYKYLHFEWCVCVYVLCIISLNNILHNHLLALCLCGSSSFESASQKAVLVLQTVFFLDAAQRAFNSTRQLVNATARSRAALLFFVFIIFIFGWLAS